ncbi:MAG: hypothetical protein JSV79_14700 [Armatimonadota bacterium]|nr:MAG: hypothetical protein JSV79_14700 [Armatimonadota bacterium]
MRGLIPILVVPLLCANGCQRAPSTAAPEPDRIEALLRAGAEQPAPKQGDTQGVPRSAGERMAWRKAQEDDIYEAVVRVGFEYYQHTFFSRESRKRRFDQCTLFLFVKDKDPSDEFMRRFGDVGVDLRKGSEGKKLKLGPVTPDSLGQVGKMGVGDVAWTSDTSVVVEWGYYAHQRAAGGARFIVVRDKGRWVVKQLKRPWIT